MPNTKRMVCCLGFAIVASVGAGAHAAEPLCEQDGSANDSAVCAHVDYLDADARLNDAYRSALNLLGNDGRFTHAREELIASQRAWLKFREADCKVKKDILKGDSMRDAQIDQCMTDLSDERTEELQQIWLP